MKQQAYDAERPPPSRVLEEDRTISFGNAVLSTVIFVVTIAFYVPNRDSASWRARTPYSSYLSTVEFEASMTTLPPMNFSGVTATNGVPDAEAAMTAFKAGSECDTLSSQSPRCDCLVEAFTGHMNLTNISSMEEFDSKFEAYPPHATQCFKERGMVEVTVYSTRTCIFDVVLLWWTSATLCNLFYIIVFARSGRVKLCMQWVSVFVLGAAVYVFYRAAYSREWYLAILLGVPALTIATMSGISSVVHWSRPFGTRNWKEWNKVVGTDTALTWHLFVAVACAHRIMLLASGRNETTENTLSLYICLLTSMCSTIVRFLRNSLTSLHDNLIYLKNREGDTSSKYNDKKQDFESTIQSLTFAAKWTWLVLICLILTLLLLYPVQPHTVLSSVVVLSRLSLGLFFVMFALQLPTRYNRMPFAQNHQFIFFHAFETMARSLLMAFMWFYLFL